MTRDEALAFMHEYTASDALRKHMYAVEIAMRAMAERYDEDPEAWGLVGLLHDFDYERFPTRRIRPPRSTLPKAYVCSPPGDFPRPCSAPSSATQPTAGCRGTRPWPAPC